MSAPPGRFTAGEAAPAPAAEYLRRGARLAWLPVSAAALARNVNDVCVLQGPSGELADEERGLVLAVGGDTMRSISLLTQRNPADRPLALDLLWQARHAREGRERGRAGPDGATVQLVV